MSRTVFAKEALDFARGYTEGLLSQFQTPEEWVYQPHEHANHALWCAGHIARADNMAIRFIAPDKARDPEGHAELFGRGSQPTADASRYPSADEVLAYLRERRQTLLELLAGLSDADFDKSTPDDAPDFVPTIGSLFRLLVWHEGLHAGQASIASRGLGKPSVVG